MKTIKIIFRLLALPFILAVYLIARFRDTFYFIYLWIRYGGESVAFKKDDGAKLARIIELLKEERITMK